MRQTASLREISTNERGGEAKGGLVVMVVKKFCIFKKKKKKTPFYKRKTKIGKCVILACSPWQLKMQGRMSPLIRVRFCKQNNFWKKRKNLKTEKCLISHMWNTKPVYINDGWSTQNIKIQNEVVLTAWKEKWTEREQYLKISLFFFCFCFRLPTKIFESFWIITCGSVISGTTTSAVKGKAESPWPRDLLTFIPQSTGKPNFFCGERNAGDQKKWLKPPRTTKERERERERERESERGRREREIIDDR